MLLHDVRCTGTVCVAMCHVVNGQTGAAFAVWGEGGLSIKPAAGLRKIIVEMLREL